MPAKNRIKPYLEDSYYHLYNRGVEKRIIFLDQKDYKVFLSYLKVYLTPPDQINDMKTPPSRMLQNYADEISLHAYCLMPNHFHLLIYQQSQHAIRDFMRSLTTKYAMYFNRRYDRVGSLFQGRYKGVLINSDSQLVYLTKYIHRNPLGTGTTGTDPEGYPYSSYHNYLNRIHQAWVKPQRILNYFAKENPSVDYAAFVREDDLSPLSPHLTLE